MVSHVCLRAQRTWICVFVCLAVGFLACLSMLRTWRCVRICVCRLQTLVAHLRTSCSYSLRTLAMGRDPKTQEMLSRRHWVPHHYKSVICSFFLKGQCKRGKGCKYAHSEEEMRPKGPKRTPPQAMRLAKRPKSSAASSWQGEEWEAAKGGRDWTEEEEGWPDWTEGEEKWEKEGGRDWTEGEEQWEAEGGWREWTDEEEEGSTARGSTEEGQGSAPKKIVLTSHKEAEKRRTWRTKSGPMLRGSSPKAPTEEKKVLAKKRPIPPESSPRASGPKLRPKASTPQEEGGDTKATPFGPLRLFGPQVWLGTQEAARNPCWLDLNNIGVTVRRGAQ